MRCYDCGCELQLMSTGAGYALYYCSICDDVLPYPHRVDGMGAAQVTPGVRR